MDQHDLGAAADVAKGKSRRFGRRAIDKAREFVDEAGWDTKPAEDARSAATDGASGLLDRLGDNPRAQQAAERMGRVAKRVAELPGLTVISDAVQARYDLRDQVARLSDDPQSLQELIWTATAVREVEGALIRYRRVRAANAGMRLLVGEFGSAAVQISARLAGRVSSKESVPPADALLRHAYSLAVGRLRSNPTDAEAHYFLARTFFLTGNFGPGALSARAAIRTTGDPVLRGDALTALAYASLAGGQPTSAERAAEMAIESGVTTGNLVLAKLVENSVDSVAEQQKQTAAYRRSVDHDDFVRYFGPRPSTENVARAVWQQQQSKARELGHNVRRTWTNTTATEGQTDV